MTGLETIGIAAIGAVIGVVVKYFFDRWNRNYVTEESCQSCNLKADLMVVKRVVLRLAVKEGLDVQEFAGLAD